MDFKKTILWAVFSLSGLMLYNNWQVHEGKPSLFGGSPATTASAPSKPGAPAKLDTPVAISGIPSATQTAFS
jgi:YidC/Oxa1 family membrane protein insertase